MNIEKVKAIKKVLNTWEIVFHGITNADILALINEFESELEKEQINNLNCDTELQYKEKRIVELEKENAKLLDSVETVQNNRCTTKCELTEKQLKQFAERLKEKLEEYRLENEYFTEHEPNGNLWQMNSSVFYIEVTQDGGLVDETLKEFINERN